VSNHAYDIYGVYDSFQQVGVSSWSQSSIIDYIRWWTNWGESTREEYQHFTNVPFAPPSMIGIILISTCKKYHMCA